MLITNPSNFKPDFKRTGRKTSLSDFSGLPIIPKTFPLFKQTVKVTLSSILISFAVYSLKSRLRSTG